jgi:hypothetical protein
MILGYGMAVLVLLLMVGAGTILGDGIDGATTMVGAGTILGDGMPDGVMDMDGITGDTMHGAHLDTITGATTMAIIETLAELLMLEVDEGRFLTIIV